VYDANLFYMVKTSRAAGAELVWGKGRAAERDGHVAVAACSMSHLLYIRRIGSIEAV
jgi:hypothetical protein